MWIGEPRFDQGHEVDCGIHCLGLTHHARLEESPQLDPIQGNVVVEQMSRDAGRAANCGENVIFGHSPLRIFHLAEHAPQELDGAAGLRRIGAIKIGQFQQPIEEGIVDWRAIGLSNFAQERASFFGLRRLELDGLEEPPQRRIGAQAMAK